MKVIGGANKGRRIRVAKKGIRPTKGLVRAAVFNILGERVRNAVVLDVFAGTGALGLEALSRGAVRCSFIEKNPRMLRDNIRQCAYHDSSEVIAGDFRPALKRLAGRVFDIIFLDPPYDKGYVSKALIYIAAVGLLHDDGVIVAEHSLKETVAAPEGLVVTRTRSYGDTVLSFIGRDAE